MSSPLVTVVFPRIEELLEALIPPTRPRLRYRASEEKGDLEDEGADREFLFGITGHRPTAERGAAMTETEWTFDLFVHLSGSSYDAKSFPRAIANEGALIRRALDKNSTWGPGVVEVIVEDLELVEDGEDVALVWSCRATTEETD